MCTGVHECSFVLLCVIVCVLVCTGVFTSARARACKSVPLYWCSVHGSAGPGCTDVHYIYDRGFELLLI